MKQDGCKVSLGNTELEKFDIMAILSMKQNQENIV